MVNLKPILMDNKEKKVILVVPPFSEQAAMSAEEEFKRKTKELRVYPPLGLAYLAGELLSKDIGCEIIDSAALSLDEEEAAALIFKKNPNIVGITVTSFTLLAVNNLINKLRQVRPTLPIVVGGPHITYCPDAVFDLCADYGIRGDGEISFSKLVECLFRAELPSDDIEGLVTGKEKGRLINSSIAVARDLDTLAFPARNLLPKERYIFVMNYHGNFTTFTTSRGCIYDCIYCGIPHKKQVYLRSINNVINELKAIAGDSYGYVNFIDDCFTFDRDRTIELCCQIKKNNLKFRWGCATRADCVDYELLKIMKETGCYDIRFGVESGVELIRNSSIGKKVSNETFIKAVWKAKRAGLITTGFFLFGHPGETIQNMRQTIHFAKKLNTHYAVFMLATPVPGSRLFDIAVREGKLSTDIWRKISINRIPIPVYTPESIGLKQMKTLQNQASISFYLSLGNIILRLREIKYFGEFLFKLQLGLILLNRSILKFFKYSEIITWKRLNMFGRQIH